MQLTQLLVFVLCTVWEKCSLQKVKLIDQSVNLAKSKQFIDVESTSVNYVSKKKCCVDLFAMSKSTTTFGSISL